MFVLFCIWACLPLGILNLIFFITDGLIVSLIIGIFALISWAINMYFMYYERETKEFYKDRNGL